MPNSLVGREGELARLHAVAEPHPSAPPRLVLVEGEAGIGKTSLVRAFAGACAARVRWGQGGEDGAPPFWLWRQLTPETAPDPAADRFALLTALRDAVTADPRCLLVVDDVQWADEPSLLALRGLLRDPGCRGVVCCATRRTGEAGAGWERIGPDLLSGADVERIALRGLDEPAVAEVLRVTAGRRPDPAELAMAVRASAGNPLFVRELGRLLATGAEPAGGGLAEIILARVRRLDPATQQLLRAASLLAEEFELTVVARLVERPTAACLPAVSQALSAGLLHDAGAGRFRFAHDLVRAALAGQLPLQQSVVLHVRAAVALEDLHRDELSRVSAEVARHRAAAAVTGDREPAVRWAARDAAAAFAYEDAARIYASALTCGGPALTPDRRAELLIGKGAAELAAGRFTAAFEACREAAELAVRPDLVAAVALTLDAVGEHGWDRTLQGWCLRALDEPVPGALRARLLARLAEARFYGGDVTGANTAAAQALALAGTGGDGDALVAALRARQLTCSGPEHSAERAELATRMTALGERLRRPAVEMWGRLWTVDVLWERGDLAAIATEVVRLRWCVEQQRSPLARWHLLVCRAALAQARGELTDAVALGAEAAGSMAGTGHPAAAGAHMSLLGAIGHHRGHPPESFGPPAAVPALDAGEVRAALFVRLGPAFALADSGRLDEADRLYRSAGPPQEWDIPPYFTVQALAVGACIAVHLGRTADIGWFRTALDRHRGGHVVGGGGAANYLGPVDLVLGRCAAALDDLGAADELLAAALATCERIGAAGFEVEAACELAAVRLRRRDPDAARLLLTRVRPAAGRMGMTPWAARIDALLSGGGGGPLTAREREIADLVALGRSDREIAAQLVLSVRTVGNHVHHILTKLGFTNRSQVAAWVVARRMSSGMSSRTDAGGPGSA